MRMKISFSSFGRGLVITAGYCHMQEAARQMMSDYNGIFPDTYDEIIKLKGIGAYTASAISSIAFGREKGVVDGNTLRILSRIYNLQDNIAQDKTKKAFQILMDELIRGTDPSIFNQAMMDLGAGICTPRKPDCEHCPVQDFCEAPGHRNRRPASGQHQKHIQDRSVLHYSHPQKRG